MEHTWIKVDNWKDIPRDAIGCYKLTSPHNKIYIGMSCTTIFNRWRTYNSARIYQQPFLQKELEVHNDFTKWTHEYIEYPEDKCKEMEVYLIKHYDTFYYRNKEFGLNGTTGGDGIVEWNEELKEKSAFKHRVEHMLFNLVTKETTIVRGGKALKNFFNVVSTVKFNIDRIIKTIEYLNSDWKIIKNNAIVEATWKPLGYYRKGMKFPPEIRAKMGKSFLIKYELINTKTNEKCEVLGAEDFQKWFNIPWLKKSITMEKMIKTCYYHNSNWKLLKDNVIVESNWKPAGARNLGRKFSPEVIEKMRQSAMGKNKGKKRTPEQIEANRQRKLGTKQSPETIAKRKKTMLENGGLERVRQAHLGRKHSPETIEKMCKLAIERRERKLMEQQNV